MQKRERRREASFPFSSFWGPHSIVFFKSMTNPHKLLCLLPGFESLRRRPVPQTPITM